MASAFVDNFPKVKGFINTIIEPKIITKLSTSEIRSNDSPE